MCVYLMANLMIYFELWQRKEKNRCASGAKTLEIFKISSEFFRKTMDFFKISLEIFRKTLEIFRQTSEFWGVMAEKTLYRWGSGGKIGGKVRPIWCSFYAHLMLLSRPSGATFVPIWCCLRPIWCSLHARLVQPSPEGGAYK